MSKLSILSNFFKPSNFKFSGSRSTSTMQMIGQYAPSPANYATFSKEGYEKVVMVYRCVSMIAEACSGIEWEVKNKKGDKTYTDHPMLKLINNPNPMMGLSQFMEAIVSFYLIAGNSYIEAVRGSTTNPPSELWPIFSPANMSVVVGNEGYPSAYVFKDKGNERRWPVDFVDLKCDVLHLKTFNPSNIWYGLSPLQVGIQAIDATNLSATWNNSLLKNMATPSGILTVKTSDANPTGSLSKEQAEDIKEAINDRYSGVRNAGRPMLLEGGLTWQSISLSPKDMDFLKGKEVSSMDIATIYGVPGELLGLGQKTFNNYAEARAAFYTETVLPLMDFVKSELNRWLAPAFGDTDIYDYNRDDIEALVYVRQSKYATLNSSTFLNINEKREAAGYEPIPGWDVFVIGNTLGATPEDFALGSYSEDSEPSKEETDSKPTPAPDKAPKPEDTPLAATAFNGAQTSSLLEVIEKVVDGRLPRESALSIIMTAFNVDKATADSLLGEVGRGFKPASTTESAPVDDNPPTDEDEDDADPTEDESEDGKKKHVPLFKSINLLNSNEKRASWKKQNAARAKHERTFERDLNHDFSLLTNNLKTSLQENENASTLQVSLIQTFDKFKPILANTLAKHIRFTTEDFGLAVLNEGKSLTGVIETKANKKFQSFVDAFVKKRVSQAMTQIESTFNKKAHDISRRIISEGTAEGWTQEEIAQAYVKEFETISPSRARVIARTEVGIASSNGAQAAVKSLEIPGLVKEWVSAQDDRVRDDSDHANHSIMNGETAPLDGYFNVPPDAKMDGPGDESAEAEQVINCRCVLVYSQRGSNRGGDDE